MTENIPQTSASDRIEQARKVADTIAYRLRTLQPVDPFLAQKALDSIEALITPPSVGVDAQWEAAESIAAEVQRRMEGQASQKVMIYAAADRGFLAGIQYAHERWEPADRPSQEQMLRWLGIKFEQNDEYDIFIPKQHIEREEI